MKCSYIGPEDVLEPNVVLESLGSAEFPEGVFRILDVLGMDFMLSFNGMDDVRVDIEGKDTGIFVWPYF